MKYLFTITLIIILSNNLVTAQSSVYVQSGSGLVEAFQRSTPQQDIMINIRGSAYLSPSWENGTVMLEDNKKFEGVLRYNIYNQQIELLYMNNYFSINAPHEIKEIWIGTRKFIYAPIIENKKGNKLIFTGYLEILAEGKIILLMHRDKYIKEDPSTPRHPSGMNPGKNYVVKKTYYFQTEENGTILKFERKRKNLLELFGDEKNDISFFMKKQKMKNSLNETDIIEVFNYYNSLNIENTKTDLLPINLQSPE